MTDMEHAIERAAKVLADNWRNIHTNESLGKQRMLARALADAGLLASLTEWDVEYRDYDGYVSRHTDDVFDETDLGYEQAKEYADAYNDLDPSPGVAVVVRRYVTDWEAVDRAEGESWYDAEPEAMPDAGWEPIEPMDRAEGDGRADQ